MFLEKNMQQSENKHEKPAELKKQFDKRLENKAPATDTGKTKNGDFNNRIKVEDYHKEVPDSFRQEAFDKRAEIQNSEQKTTEAEGVKYEFNSKEIQNYLSDVKKHTGYELSKEYKAQMKDYLKNNEIKKLSPAETFAERKKFNSMKNELIKKWEAETGKTWPRYEEDVKNKDGIVIRRAGSPYDAHHLIEVSYGGPHETWNIVPARCPEEHQNGIHKEESTKKLFPEEKVYNR